MVKLWCIDSYGGVLLSNKQQWTVDTFSNLDGFPDNYAEGKKKLIPKDYILCDSIYMTFLK